LKATLSLPIFKKDFFAAKSFMKFFKILLLLCLTYFTVEPSTTVEDDQAALVAPLPPAARKCWRPLSPGDKIALVAPSNAPTAGAIEKARSLLVAQRFVPDVPDDMVSVQPFNRSNTIEYRTAHFLKALHSDVKVIWALRGGRGASEIFMDPTAFNEFRGIPPKLLIGFSDATVFHLWANSIGWPTLHGVVLSFCQENEHTVNAATSLDIYFKILRGEVAELTYDLVPENEFAKAATIKDSSIVGGNLSLIQRSIGTSTVLNTDGRILFIEDIGEEGSRLHETLVQIERASILERARAVIWGNFKSDDAAGIAEAKKQFLQRMEKRSLPVFSADYFGHGPLNMPLPFNTHARIEAGGKLIVYTNN
jgi:muramoyltetrapeptide carboxypeptidase